jgi:hypothetical protein
VAPRTDQIRRLMHALREPVGAFAINLSLLADDDLNGQARKRVATMKTNVRRMTEALSEIAAAFDLELEIEAPVIPVPGKNGRTGV